MDVHLIGSAQPHELVEFLCPGLEHRAAGRWMSDAAHQPGPVNVELEFRDDFAWDRTIRVVAAAPSLATSAGRTIVVATVLDAEANGVLTLRIGDGIVVVSTIGEPPSGLPGATVELTADEVELYPYDL